MTDELPQDGLAGSARGFSVIVGPIDFTLGPQPISIAHVARIMKLTTVVLHHLVGFSYGLDMTAEGKEFAPLL